MWIRRFSAPRSAPPLSVQAADWYRSMLRPIPYQADRRLPSAPHDFLIPSVVDLFFVYEKLNKLYGRTIAYHSFVRQLSRLEEMGWIHFIRHYDRAPWSAALVNVEGVAYTLETKPDLLESTSATSARTATPSTSLLVLTLAAIIGCLPGYMRFARLNRWTWLTLASQGYSYAMPRALRKTGYPRKDLASVPYVNHQDWVWTWAPSAVTATLCPDDRLTRRGVEMFGGYYARRRVFTPDDWYAPVYVAPLPFQLVSEREWVSLHDDERAWLFWAEPVENAFASLDGVPVLPRQLALRHELRMTPSPLELIVPFAANYADDAIALDFRPPEILPPVGARLPDTPGPRSSSGFGTGAPSEPRTVLLEPVLEFSPSSSSSTQSQLQQSHSQPPHASQQPPAPSSADLPAASGYVQVGPTWYERVWNPPGPWTVLDRLLMDPWMTGAMPPCWVPIDQLGSEVSLETTTAPELPKEPKSSAQSASEGQDVHLNNSISSICSNGYVETLVARLLKPDASGAERSERTEDAVWCAPSSPTPAWPTPTWTVSTLWPTASALELGYPGAREL